MLLYYLRHLLKPDIYGPGCKYAPTFACTNWSFKSISRISKFVIISKRRNFVDSQVKYQLLRCAEKFCRCYFGSPVVLYTVFSLTVIFEISDKGMIKQGFYEAPWITLSMLLLPFPFLFTPYVLWRYDQLDGEGKRYAFRYTSESKTSPSGNNYPYFSSLTKTLLYFISVFRPDHPHLKYFTYLNDRTVSKPEWSKPSSNNASVI